MLAYGFHPYHLRNYINRIKLIQIMPLITSIKPQKNKKRVNIYLDGRSDAGFQTDKYFKILQEVAPPGSACSVDANCVGFSQFWLRDILRRRLGFNGAILSDDLNMEGANISSDHVDRITMAREAGCDFTLLCNNRPGVIRALDRLPQAKYQVECNKWRPLQGGSRQ